MVRTRPRAPAPANLLSKQQCWTDRWRAIHAQLRRGDWATSFAKKTLREALSPLTHGKCAYCESTLGVTTGLEIEHYVAKSVALDLAFEWTNLLPACHECNTAKGEFDHRNAVLKPDDEDPELHFWINMATGELEANPTLDEPSRRRAEETIRVLNLQRGGLCNNRVLLMQRMRRWLERASRAGRLSPRLQEEWEELVHPAAEYKLVLRWLLELHGESELADEDRRRFQAPTIRR